MKKCRLQEMIFKSREDIIQMENEWKQKVTVLLEENYEKSRKEKKELFNRLQEYTKEKDKHVVFFGCGVQGRVIYHILKKQNIEPDFFCDNNKNFWGG